MKTNTIVEGPLRGQMPYSSNWTILGIRPPPSQKVESDVGSQSLATTHPWKHVKFQELLTTVHTTYSRVGPGSTQYMLSFLSHQHGFLDSTCIKLAFTLMQALTWTVLKGFPLGVKNLKVPDSGGAGPAPSTELIWWHYNNAVKQHIKANHRMPGSQWFRYMGV